MKTTESTATATAPQPGNLTTRQLAQSLTKIPATSQTETTETETAEPETEATSRETSPATNGKSRNKPATLSNPEPEADADPEAETETAESPEGTESTESTETAGTEEAGAEGAEGTETEETTTETAEADEPVSVTDQVSKHLEAELGDLIGELQKAGAKGALQILQKRIPKLTDQRDTERNGRLAAEEQNTQLRRELQEARNHKPEANGHSQANGFTDPKVRAVVNELQNVDHWLAYCESTLPQLASGDLEVAELPDGRGGKYQLNAQQLASIQRDLQNQRTALVARKEVVSEQAKAAWKQEYQKHHAVAVKEFPWLAKPESAQHQEFQAILQLFPAFKQAPDYELAIGDFLAGKALREARAKARTNGTQLRRAQPSREPTRVVSAPPGGAADREPSDEKDAKAADEQFRKSGRTSDLARSLTAKARASRAK